MSIYTEQGFQSRKDYLVNRANDFGLPVNTVFMAASTLGPSEDFDGLISTLEDIDPEDPFN